MPVQKVPVTNLDDPNHKRRRAEVLNQLLDHTADDYRRQTDAEILAGVTPVNKAFPPYVRGRYGSWTDWRLACDQAGSEGYLEADYAITEAIYLPKKSDFCGFKITGNFQTIHAYHGSAFDPGVGWVKNWRAARPFIAGTYSCDYTNVDTLGDANTDILLLMGGDGVGDPAGCFWNRITITLVGKTHLDADEGDVNFNTIGGGISRYNHLTGGGVGVGQIHANRWLLDASHSGGAPADSGFLQEDAMMQRNFIPWIYYENGANVRGNFKIDDWQADTSTGMPLVLRHNHIMGAVGINERVRNDFIAVTPHNLASGGCWDWLDSRGVPPSFNHAGGASVSVITDTTEPGGVGKRYEATFADALDRFIVTCQASGTSQTGVLIFYKSSADFAAIESNYSGSSGATSHGTEAVVVSGDWKMLRLSCPASPTAVLTISLFGQGGSAGASKTMSLGSVWAGSELAVMHPGKNPDYETFHYTPTLTSVTNVAATTAYSMMVTRVGNFVSVDGRIDVDPTAAAPTATEVGISLPIAPTSAFSATEQCVGNGASLDHAQSGPVLADVANNRAALRFQALNTANDAWGVHFTYRMS